MNITRCRISKNVCIFKIIWLIQEICIFPLGHIKGDLHFLLLPTLVGTMMWYNNNQPTMQNTMNDNNNNQPMLPGKILCQNSRMDQKQIMKPLQARWNGFSSQVVFCVSSNGSFCFFLLNGNYLKFEFSQNWGLST